MIAATSAIVCLFGESRLRRFRDTPGSPSSKRSQIVPQAFGEDYPRLVYQNAREEEGIRSRRDSRNEDVFANPEGGSMGVSGESLTLDPFDKIRCGK